jgi:hypothetical protein
MLPAPLSVVAFALTLSCSGTVSDRLLGDWVYDPKQSTLSPGQQPNRSMLRRHTRDGDGLVVQREIVDAAGRLNKTRFRLTCDGQRHRPIEPPNSTTTWALSTTGANSIRVAIQYENGNVLHQDISVSSDGTRLFVVESGQDAGGLKRSHTSVFARR